MGYLQFISNMINIFMQAAAFSIGQGEPMLAILNIQAANVVLPPDSKDPDSGEITKGYRVDLTKVLPQVTPRDDNEKMYMDESRKGDANQWIAINNALQLVSQAVSRYAHDNKDKWGSM